VFSKPDRWTDSLDGKSTPENMFGGMLRGMFPKRKAKL
jgi:hypothetical protein